jgi:DNA mismatch repair protein MSH5
LHSDNGYTTGERDEDADALNEIIMAVDVRGSNGTIGCAYYVAREEVLYIMQDAHLGGKAMVDQRKAHILSFLIYC